MNYEVYNNYSYLSEMQIINSIVYSTEYAAAQSVNSYTSWNSIGLNINDTDDNFYNFEGIPYQNLYNYSSFASVFKNFRGSLGEGVTFELQDSIATKILGTDGKQVGIYGGTFPFDPYVRHPYIRKCNVASKSTEDGKLSVDIEVVSEKE